MKQNLHLQGYLSAANFAISVIATRVSKQKNPDDISRTVLSTYSKDVVQS